MLSEGKKAPNTILGDTKKYHIFCKFILSLLRNGLNSRSQCSCPDFSPPHIIGHISLLSHICISPTCICRCLRACRWLLFKSHYFVILEEGSSVTHRQKFIEAAGSDSRKSRSSSLLASRAFWGRY